MPADNAELNGADGSYATLCNNKVLIDNFNPCCIGDYLSKTSKRDGFIEVVVACLIAGVVASSIVMYYAVAAERTYNSTVTAIGNFIQLGSPKQLTDTKVYTLQWNGTNSVSIIVQGTVSYTATVNNGTQIAVIVGTEPTKIYAGNELTLTLNP